MRDDSKEAHVALEAWARWARSAFSGLGFSSMNVLARIIELGLRGAAQSFGPMPIERDEVCELVDRAILRLDEIEKVVILRTYLRDEAAQVTAQKCGLTYGYYREVLAKARQRVGDYLNGAKNGVVFPTTKAVG
jgi:DNA-directed RNA polymerase specialized sigma24 family protein